MNLENAPNRIASSASAVILVGSILTMGSNPALAADDTSSKGSQLEEIIVTAQKRVENLQQVPISAQVVSGQILAQQNLNSLEELTQTVPGVHVSSSGGFSNDLFIRGIGSIENPTFEQSVATFVDDIYLDRSRLSEAVLLDLDRIEILKGPQSTYFGNNAIAGALNIVTKKPGDTFEASARALYGMFGQYAVEGAVGGPISDTFGVRVAVTRNGDDRGWIENVNTDQHVPTVNNLAGRVTLDFHPNEALDAIFKIEASEHHLEGSYGDLPTQLVNCPPPAPITAGTGAFGECAQALALGTPTGLDQNKISALAGQGSSLSTFEDVLTVNYRQWGQIFTSVSGFYNYHAQTLGSSVLPIAYQTYDIPESEHQFSQELRVASDSTGPVQYLAGVYFQTDQFAESTEYNLPFLNPTIEFLAGGPLPALAPLLPYLPVGTSGLGLSQHNRVLSGFGSISWNVTDSLKLNAGLRESSVEKDYHGFLHYGYANGQIYGTTPLPPTVEPLMAFLLGPPTDVEFTRTDNALMPSAGIQYQLDRDAMIYFSYNKGFKAGGFNQLATQPFTYQNLGYQPEHVNAFELGLKSKWFDERLLVDLDVFRSNYSNLQNNATILNPTTDTYFSTVRNASESRSQGIELETQWLITKDLRLSANVTYLDAYYISYPNGSQSTLQSFCATSYVLPYCSVYPNPVPAYANLAGQPLDYSPHWSGSVAAAYGLTLPGDYRLITKLSPYLTSRYFTGGDGYDPFNEVGGYVRLDAMLTLEAPQGHLAIDLIGKNLTDRTIVGTTNLNEATKEEPRNVAIQFRYHWGRQ